MQKLIEQHRFVKYLSFVWFFSSPTPTDNRKNRENLREFNVSSHWRLFGNWVSRYMKNENMNESKITKTKQKNQKLISHSVSFQFSCCFCLFGNFTLLWCFGANFKLYKNIYFVFHHTFLNCPLKNELLDFFGIDNVSRKKKSTMHENSFLN
jgi:hypothetical protein